MKQKNPTAQQYDGILYYDYDKNNDEIWNDGFYSSTDWSYTLWFSYTMEESSKQNGKIRKLYTMILIW